MRKELRPVHDLVACDLCHRTILKGERIETFVGAGERHRVCELCSLRALRSGWVRESELERQAPDRERPRPRRSLWSRAVTWAEDQGLRGAPPPAPDADGGAPAESRPVAGADDAAVPEVGKAGPDGEPPAPPGPAEAPPTVDTSPAPVASPAPDAWGAGEASGAPDAPAGPEPSHPAAGSDRAGDPFRDLARSADEAWEAGATGRRRERERRYRRAEEGAGHPDGAGDRDDGAPLARRSGRNSGGAGLRDLISGRRREPREVSAVPTSRWGKIERALELFNDSEHRRTIAGVGRALGEPWVSAAPLDDGPAAREVAIVVAWELSWYRYRVDLDDADQAVLLLDRGNELGDLDQSQRHWNVGADAEGRLALAVEVAS